MKTTTNDSTGSKQNWPAPVPPERHGAQAGLPPGPTQAQRDQARAARAEHRAGLSAEYYTAAEVAALFNVSARQVGAWRRKKLITSVPRPGGVQSGYLYPRAEIDRLRQGEDAVSRVSADR